MRKYLNIAMQIKHVHQFTYKGTRSPEIKKNKKNIPEASPTGFEELLMQRDYGTHDSGGWQQETA